MFTITLLILILTQCMTLFWWWQSARRLKAISSEADHAAAYMSDLADELSWRRARDQNVSRQLVDLSKDLVNAQRTIVAIHGADLLTPERQAIITAAALVDQARIPMEAEWESST